MLTRDGMRIVAILFKVIASLVFGIPALSVILVGNVVLFKDQSLSPELALTAAWAVAILVGIIGFWLWLFWRTRLNPASRVLLSLMIATGSTAAVLLGLLGSPFLFFALLTLVSDADALFEIWFAPKPQGNCRSS